ncbi:hypothetical protein QAD02_006178 [Eretmocerus hayati]|uniref:Uncharacterized protein n=1 Tax=Eretmocerus hayati TaxID=131215 RepID=A0ACC2N0Y9_9HYME|nr:hypothetical protein QAD02_006178 [Eretmocerus hayati]
MSAIKELISKLRKEDETRQQEYEKELAVQYEKYEEMIKKLNSLRDDTKNCVESIIKGSEQLVANKHTIEKALEQAENLTGLPIPFEHHGDVMDLFSKMTSFLNNAEHIDPSKTFSPEEIHEKVVSISEKEAETLKEFHNEFAQAQNLLYSTKVLKSLIEHPNDNDTQQLDGSMLND